jgi:hypothetical protein
VGEATLLAAVAGRDQAYRDTNIGQRAQYRSLDDRLAGLREEVLDPERAEQLQVPSW